MEGPSPALDLIRWSMAERFGWTLDYIDNLPLGEVYDFIRIEEGRAKARPAPKTGKRKSR
jgi:hypothetical protein